MLNFLKKLKSEHDAVNLYEFEDYYTFDDIEDLHSIVTNAEIPSGVYVHSVNSHELFMKVFDEQGRILIGLSNELTSGGEYFVATEDGLAVKDNSKQVSTSEVENFLVMSDLYGFEEFVLVDVSCDRHVNLINWYGLKRLFPEIIHTESQEKPKRKYTRKKNADD